MSNPLAADVRKQYEQAFATIRVIVEAFPEDKWLEPHGNAYYLPCRIALHLADAIDRYVADGHMNPEFESRLPYDTWMEITAENLPSKEDFLSYFSEAVGRAHKELAAIVDASLTAAIEPEQAQTMGATQMAGHLYTMRELSAHTGELNKMLIENGLQDIWVSR